MKSEVHVAIVRDNLLDEDYNRHTAVTMISVMENCSKTVHFHIIYRYPKIIPPIGLYDDILSKFGGKISFHHCELDNDIMALPNIEESISSYLTPAGLFRLFLPIIIPDIDFCYSLGSDVIVNADLAKLLDQIPKTYSIYGCSDTGYHLHHLETYLKLIGIEDLKKWINADVLLFNLKKIRNENTLPNHAIQLIKTNCNIRYLEQDVLSIIFKDDLYLLPQQYNIQFSDLDLVDKIMTSLRPDDDYIFHYCGREKPWKRYLSKYDMEYWRYRLQCERERERERETFEIMAKAIPLYSNFYDELPNYIWTKPLSIKIKMLSYILIYIPTTIIKQYIKHLIQLIKP